MNHTTQSHRPKTSKSNLAAGDFISFNIRFWWLILLSFFLQWVTFLALPPSSMVEVKKAVLVLSYLLLLAALSRNLHLWGLRLIAFGILLNFAAIVANGGLMPVSPEARVEAHGLATMAGYDFGDLLPRSKCILLPVDQMRLWFLSDVIPITSLHDVVSVGDIVVAGGLSVFFVEAIYWATTRFGRDGKHSDCGR